MFVLPWCQSGNPEGYYALGGTTGLFTAAMLLPTTGFTSINNTVVVAVSDGVNTVQFTFELAILDIPLPPYFLANEVRCWPCCCLLAEQSVLASSCWYRVFPLTDWSSFRERELAAVHCHSTPYDLS